MVERGSEIFDVVYMEPNMGKKVARFGNKYLENVLDEKRGRKRKRLSIPVLKSTANSSNSFPFTML
jgi:hypothetical protein